MLPVIQENGRTMVLASLQCPSLLVYASGYHGPPCQESLKNPGQ